MDINRQQSVGLIIIRPKNPQSDRKSDRLTMFRPKIAQYYDYLLKVRKHSFLGEKVHIKSV